MTICQLMTSCQSLPNILPIVEVSQPVQPRSRNETEKSMRRLSILEGAEKVFFNKGFDKCSMDDIAKEAGLSRSLLYVYFKDKNDIHLALCLKALESFHNRQERAIRNHPTGLARIRAFGESYYQFYKEEPNNFKLLCARMGMHSELHAHPEEAELPGPELLAHAEQQSMELMARCLQQGLDDGSIDPEVVVNPLQTAMFLRGALHGVIMLQDASGSRLFDRVQLDREALIRYSIDCVIDKIRTH